MKEEKQVKKLLSDLNLLSEVATTFSEIASSRMQKIRQEVLNARDFQLSLYSVFKDVLASYVAEVNRLKRLKKLGEGEKITFLAHNGKTVAVFISANAGLYGDIVGRTFDLFAKEVRQGEVEVAIVGKLGLSLFLETFPSHPYTYFDFPDFGGDAGLLAKVVGHIVQYDEVHLYFGRYESLIRQMPTKFNISAEVPLEGAGSKERVGYIFEPTLTSVLGFFESELFTSLFDHTIYESQLAKFASRMIAMDTAYQNISEKVQKVSLEALRAGHAATAKKQQASVIMIYTQGVINGR